MGVRSVRKYTVGACGFRVVLFLVAAAAAAASTVVCITTQSCSSIALCAYVRALAIDRAKKSAAAAAVAAT